MTRMNPHKYSSSVRKYRTRILSLVCAITLTRGVNAFLSRGYRSHEFTFLSAVGMIVEEPITVQNTIKADNISQDERSILQKENKFRIRSMVRNDVQQVAQILAEGLVDSKRSTWFTMLELAKAKHMFISQLIGRLSVLEEARKQQLQKKIIDMPESNHVLWRSDNFRTKLRNAAMKSTTSDTPWKNHDFVILKPEETTLLHHSMIVAEDLYTNQIVGYIEVAMLQTPDHKNVLSPTIGNLATKSDFRRRGVAKRLLTSAIRHTRYCWIGANSIGLYVNKNNNSAASLYKKFGFRPVMRSHDEDQKNMEEDRTLLYYERPVELSVS